MRQPRERSRLGYRIFYGIALFAILIVWVYAFKSYFEHYDSIHPEIAWAVPWMEVDSVTAKGIFLWNETRLASPRDLTQIGARRLKGLLCLRKMPFKSRGNT